MRNLDSASERGSGGSAPRSGLVAFAPLLAAVVVGIVCGLPHVVISARVDGVYTPFAVRSGCPIVYDETLTFGALVREVLQGHWLSGDPDGFEYKEQPARALPFLLPTVVTAALARLLGGSVAAAFILADFLFPALAVICAYFVARNLNASVPVALFAAVLVVLGTDLVGLPVWLVKSPGAAWTDGLLNLRGTRPVEFSRTYVPQFSYCLLLLAVLMLQGALKHAIVAGGALAPARRRLEAGGGKLETTKDPGGQGPRHERLPFSMPVAAGLVAGLLFYTYAYAWPYFLVAAVICLVWLASAADKRSARCVAGVIAIALLVGSPVVLSKAATLSGGRAPDLIRFGVGITAIPWAAQKYRLLLSALIVLLYPRKRREYPIIVAFLVAPFLCVLGSQLSGLRLQEWHWIRRDWAPWVLLSVPLLLDVRIHRHRRLLGGVWIALALLVAAYGVNKQYRWAVGAAEHHVMGHDRGEGIRWLQANAAPDSVVMGIDFDVLGFLPVYTNCDIYMPFSTLTPASNEELMERFAHTCAMLQVNKRDMFEMLAPSEVQSSPTIARDWPAHHWVFVLSRPQFTITGHDRQVLSEAWERASQVRGPDALPFKVDYLWAVAREGRPAAWAPPGWVEAWRGERAVIFRLLAVSY